MRALLHTLRARVPANVMGVSFTKGPWFSLLPCHVRNRNQMSECVSRAEIPKRWGTHDYCLKESPAFTV